MGSSPKAYPLLNVKDGEDLFTYYYLVLFMFWVKNKCFVVEHFFFFCMLASDLGFEEDGRMLMMMMMMGLVAHLRA